jgi:hypothetical protein
LKQYPCATYSRSSTGTYIDLAYGSAAKPSYAEYIAMGTW